MLIRPTHGGFTLVELLITVAIAGILLSLAFPSFRAWMQNAKIRTAAEGIQNGLQLARTEAVRRNTRVSWVDNNGAWSVGCVAVVLDADGDGVDECPAIIQSRSADELGSVRPTITIVPAGSTTVIFNGLGRVATLNPDGTEVAPPPITQIDVDAPAGTISTAESRDMHILIGSGGQIRSCDSFFAAPDPRAC